MGNAEYIPRRLNSPEEFDANLTVGNTPSSEVGVTVFAPIGLNNVETTDKNLKNFSNQYLNGIVKDSGSHKKYEIIAQLTGDSNINQRVEFRSRIVHRDSLFAIKNISIQHREYVRNNAYDGISDTLILSVDDLEIGDRIFLEARINNPNEEVQVSDIQFVIKEIQ